MREVGAFEAKNKLGQLLDLVERGEEVLITRHGKKAGTDHRADATPLEHSGGRRDRVAHHPVEACG